MLSGSTRAVALPGPAIFPQRAVRRSGAVAIAPRFNSNGCLRANGAHAVLIGARKPLPGSRLKITCSAAPGEQAGGSQGRSGAQEVVSAAEALWAGACAAG